jgi:uncharacterized protein
MMATTGSRFSELWTVTLAPELLAILVCPVTRTALVYDEAAGELISDAAGLAFPVRDDVPVMLVEEARVITKEL